ncbi:IPT/TIG domain-containing protein [Thiolapillus sp.]
MFMQLAKICLLVVAGGIATASWAAVPAPPVNQNIGIPDGVFNDLERRNCWYCHASDRLTPDDLAEIGWTFDPPEIKPGIITNRHHARIGQVIQNPTDAPFGTPGEIYECIACHVMEFNPDLGYFEVGKNFENCLNCHQQIPGQASVHHLTAPAQALNCQHCHGSLVDNPGDGHYIPTNRPPTSVTPRTSVGKGPNGEGACDFCHATGTDVTGRLIPGNDVNHHSTGIGQDGISGLGCNVCHDQMGTDWAIRKCQDCHGIKSIHNIQADSNNDGIVSIGGEDPGFGHIGSSPEDCNGCHGGYLAASFMPAPFSGPVSPELTGLSQQSVTAGSAATITVTGTSLINEVLTFMGPMEIKSRARLTAPDGTVTELPPDAVSVSSMDVTLPSTLDPGSYYLRVVKGRSESNPMPLIVLPYVAIEGISKSGSSLTISGSGFGSYLNAVDSGTSISIAGAACDVESWTDSEIVANCEETSCGGLTVESIFGSAYEEVSCN